MATVTELAVLLLYPIGLSSLKCKVPLLVIEIIVRR